MLRHTFVKNNVGAKENWNESQIIYEKKKNNQLNDVNNEKESDWSNWVILITVIVLTFKSVYTCMHLHGMHLSRKEKECMCKWYCVQLHQRGPSKLIDVYIHIILCSWCIQRERTSKNIKLLQLSFFIALQCLACNCMHAACIYCIAFAAK